MDEGVTDTGLVAIFQSCRNLTSLEVGDRSSRDPSDIKGMVFTELEGTLCCENGRKTHTAGEERRRRFV